MYNNSSQPMFSKKRSKDGDSTQNSRIDIILEILDQISKLAAGHSENNTEVSQGGVQIDSIITGLNKLSEEISSSVEEINESKVRFNILSEATSEAIVLTEENLIFDINLNFLDLMLYSFEDVKGKNILNLIAPESYHLVDYIASTTDTEAFEVFMMKKTGEVFPVDLSIKTMPYQGRTICVTTLRDLTPQRTAEEKVRISDRMASIGQLSAGIAHEINNPLTYVSLNLELATQQINYYLKQKPCPELETILAIVQETNKATNKIKTIARDLKSYSHSSQAGTIESVDMVDVMDSAARMAAFGFKSQAMITKDYQQVPFAAANEGRLGQVFLNLIVNAAQAMPERDISQNKIHLVLKTNSGGKIIAEVQDTGMGMNEEIRQRLFTPFFTTKPIGQGTGLGLSLCQNIINSFDGKIEVESTLNVGTTFRITLNPSEVQKRPDAIAKETAIEATELHSSKRGHIFLVDDDIDLTETIDILLNEDHDVIIANSGKKALEILETKSDFDVILMDMSLGDTTGMSIYENVQKSKPELLPKFIFMTGGATNTKTQEFIKKIPNMVIEKPFEIDSLRDRVKKAIVTNRSIK